MDPDKILHAYVGPTQIARVKILAFCAKGAQNGGKKVHVFVTDTMNSRFFVTGQIGMKFRQTTLIGVQS